MTERVADLADNVTGAITKEAEAQGLTPETLKQATSEAGRKVQNVVAHSAEGLRSVPLERDAIGSIRLDSWKPRGEASLLKSKAR